MALDKLNDTINGLRDAGTAAIDNHRRRMESIRTDRSLSAEGRAAQLARNLVETKKILTELQKKETDALTTHRSELERKIFGQYSKDPSSLIAYRDAQDRASRLNREDRDKALDMLRTAHISGDDTLAAALVGRAMQIGWPEIVDQYRANNPAGGGTLTDLNNIIHFQEDEKSQWQAEAAYYVSAPSELSRHTDASLTQLADEAAAQEAPPTPFGLQQLARDLA